MDDLDTGLGWDDLGTLGTNTGTPSTSKPDYSRQQLSETQKPKPDPIQEDDRESPFQSQGLRNLNMQSPTNRTIDPVTEAKSPVFGTNQNTARKSPGNETPDNWRTSPTEGGKTTPKTGRSGQTGQPTSKPGSRNGGYQSPTDRNQNNKSPGNRSQANVSPSNRSQNNTQRKQDSGLDDV